ncbi:hypothetical protein FF1_034525 [Malus domestica]
MVEAQTWTTRRMSNPRLQDTTSPDQVVDIPATPPGDVRNGTSYGFSSVVGSLLSPTISTAAIIASWYLSNIGVLILNKYLLSFYGFRHPIFFTMLHMISCTAYSYVAIHLLEIVPHQHTFSSPQFFEILALSAIFCFSIVCGNTSLHYRERKMASSSLYIQICAFALFTSLLDIITQASHGECGLPNKHTSTVPLFVFGDSIFDGGKNNYFSTVFQGNYWPYGETYKKGHPTGVGALI